MRGHLQTSVVVHDQSTELVVQPFADRILVLVTQMGKVGSLIQASVPSSSFDVSDLHEAHPAPAPAIQLTPIFGSAPSAHMQTLYSLYAAQIATLVWTTVGGERRSVVVGIALRRSDRDAGEELGEEERQTFHGIMDALRALLRQSATCA